MRHEAGYFSSDGVDLFEQHWTPAGASSAVVLIVHGYAEHSGRYEHVAKFLTDRGYAVEAYDLRGHGHSAGIRVFIRSVDEHLSDLQNVLSRVLDRFPGLPVFLLGHSMGGAIVPLFVIRAKPVVRGVVLSGPAITSRRKTPRIVLRLFLIIGRLFPKVRLGKLASADVSRDPEVVKKYDEDPLVYRKGMPAGTLAAMIRAGREVHAHMEDFAAAALLLMHGAEDNLTDPAGSQELFERARTVDKEIKIYPGLFHEIFNEPEQNEVLSDLADWLDARR
jgi:alpha-beta hydrolase superfamily lysophospholipase